MYQSNLEQKIEFYNNPELLDNPFHPNGFKGTWQFSSHDLIPNVFHGFIQRYFGIYRIRRIPLEKINSILNELWEGPGSLEKIFRLEDELRASGKDVKFTAADQAAIKAKKDNLEDERPLSDAEDLFVIGFEDTDE